jgi:hypothetical protein
MSNRDFNRVRADMNRVIKNPTEEPLSQLEGSANPTTQESEAQFEQLYAQYDQQSGRLQDAINAVSKGSNTEENSAETLEMIARITAELALTSTSTPKPRAVGRSTPPSQPPTPPRDPQGPPPAQIDIAAFNALLDASEQQEADAAKAREEQVWAELNAQAEAEFDESQLANFPVDDDELEREYAELELEERQLANFPVDEAQLAREFDEFVAQDPPQEPVQEQERVTPSASPAAAAARPAAAPQASIARHSPTPEAAPASTAASTAAAAPAPAPAPKGFWGNIFQKIKDGFNRVVNALFNNTEKQKPGPTSHNTHQGARTGEESKHAQSSTERIFEAQAKAQAQAVRSQNRINRIERMPQELAKRIAERHQKLEDRAQARKEARTARAEARTARTEAREDRQTQRQATRTTKTQEAHDATMAQLHTLRDGAGSSAKKSSSPLNSLPEETSRNGDLSRGPK